MRFLLVFALCFVSLFASAQIPMAVGGPQGIDVTRILARNWMSIPTYTDTPAAPLTGTPWPGRGYIIQVAKSGDTSVWQYTGVKWTKIGGVAENNYTYLVSGGSYTKALSSNIVIVRASTYYIQGTFYSISQTPIIGFPKTSNSNGRIDAVVLGPSGASILQGAESQNPASPSIPANRLKIGFIYYAPFDTLPQITGNELTSAFRIPGRDSIYFTSGDTTIAVKDSIGISRTDTASMLTNYINTASNGLTKVGKDIRLGGALNQQTRIALGGNGINIVGSADSSRFFGNGSVAVGYRANPGVYPDDSTYRFAVNGTSRLNGVVTYKGDLLPQNTPNAYTLGITQGSSFGAIRAYKNNGATSIQQIELGDNATGLNTAGTLSSPSAANYGFRIYGNGSAVDSGGGSYTNFRISPSINYSTNFKKAIHMGLSYEPTVSSLNNTTHIAFRNTRGSNLFNVNSGNTLIGYDTTSAAYQVDTTFKLGVNGNVNIQNILNFNGTTPGNIKITNGNAFVGGSASNGARLIAIGEYAGSSLQSTGGASMISIGYNSGGSLTTGGRYSTFIGRNAGGGITTGDQNIIISGSDQNNIPSSTSNAIHLVAGGGYEYNNAATTLNGLTSNYAFIGGGYTSGGYIKDFYLGGGPFVLNPEFANLNLYAPSGINKVDTLGSNFTINAGRGTGAGVGGSVIFRTSTPTTSGTTIQTLTERARISPAGNLLVGRTVDSIYKLDVNGTSRLNGTTTFTDFTTSNDIKIGTTAGSYTAVVAIGQQLSVNNYNKVGSGRAVLIGHGNNNDWGTVGSNDISIGQDNKLSTTSTANGSIQIGTSLRSSGTSTLIGSNGNDNGFNVISIDRQQATPSAKFDFTENNQTFIRGNSIFFGNPNNANQNVTINGNKATNPNSIGGDITISAGAGKGTAAPSDVVLSTSNSITNPNDSNVLHTPISRVVVKGGTGNLLVGTTTDVASSKLTVTSTTQGFLPPRMTGAQAELISSPAEGLMIYSTDGSGTTITSKGWWGYNGTTWQKLN